MTIHTGAMALEKLNSEVAKVLEQTPDPLERLRQLLMAHVRVIRDKEGILRILSDELHNGRSGRKEQVWKMVSRYLKRVAQISRGQKDGQARPCLDPDTVSAMFLGLIQPAAISGTSAAVNSTCRGTPGRSAVS